MPTTVTIQGTPIQIAISGDAPNWSEGWDDFAQAVATALSGIVGTFDVSPQVIDISADNGASNVAITPLSFSTGSVQSVEITYATYRTTTSDNTAESGKLFLTYNNSTLAWDIARQIDGGNPQTAGGDLYITFTVNSSGQVFFSTNTMAGTDHTGRISIAAKALLQANS